MSTLQRIHVRTLVVIDRPTADVLRTETKKVLMFGHDDFEDFVDFSPTAQQSLATRFTTAFDVITTLGWEDPEDVDPAGRAITVATNDPDPARTDPDPAHADADPDPAHADTDPAHADIDPAHADSDPARIDSAHADPQTYEVPLTEDLINLLGLRRYDLAMTNIDRLDTLGPGETVNAEMLAAITANREAAKTLDRLFDTYTNTTRG